MDPRITMDNPRWSQRWTRQSDRVGRANQIVRVEVTFRSPIYAAFQRAIGSGFQIASAEDVQASEISQGHGRPGVDVPPAAVCQHRRVALRSRQQTCSSSEEVIDKCPAQARGQTSLFGGVQSCLCGFHLPRGTSDQPASTSWCCPYPTSAQTTRRPPLNISMFTKPRFGGTHSAAAKPNVNIPRRKLGHQSSSASSPLSESASPSPSASVTAGTHPSSTLKASSFPPSTVRASPSPSESVRASPSPSESVRASPSPSESVRASPSPSESGDPITSAAPSGVPTSAPPAPDDGSGSVSSLPPEMRKTIPLQDQRWIASTLYLGGRLWSGLKLWYEPPVPSLIYHQAPLPDRFFTHRLLVWMPYHLWKVRLFCPVSGKQLTGYGIHKRARRVLDIDSQTVLNQLDLPHRALFRVILTYKYACDIRVIRLLRERTLGNSPTRLARQLKENHGEEWLHHLAHYMEACAVFADRPSFLPVAFQEPPQPIEVPTSK
ncbi:hypothetical protein PHYPO_G00029970 [Pangasianodon hypophthalmus]|uniref:DUF6729 domain-containing protein n=1 Tax=Pangasianodon hypophthalmus TaxID=310915 RepID=A0A5N5MJL3_PANHP|nr:hypothetical protein PHYPO_G00029970 [Pangasianodon hypophthalmus]